MLVSAVVFLVKIYVQCGLVDAVLLLYRFFIRFHKIEPVKDAIGQDEARKELKLCRCVVFHTSKVRSFDTQTYLQVYVYVTLCHGSLQVSQYVPIFALVGMKAAGVESRSSWGRMLTSDAFSAALMATTVNVMKLVIDSRRPDGTALNSFPSGHSATAFMAATMFHKEYGVRSPWYSIGAYTVATATSVSRLLNNRHWVSDVMVGAGIGILSTELGYYFADLIFGKKGLRHPQYDFDVTYSDISSFLGLYMGFTMMPHHISLSPEINFNTSTGSTVGVEGAYYITPYVGVGAELLASSIPMKIQSGLSVPSNAHLESGAFNTITTSLGAYFSLPISKRWYLGSKLLAGYGNFQGNGVDVVWNDSETREEVRSDFLKMKHANFFNAGTGISLSFWAKKNLLAKGFLDYKVGTGKYSIL